MFRNPNNGNVLFALLVFSVLSGCAPALEWKTLQRDQNLLVPRAASVLDVPIFTQREHECGPAAMSAVMKFGGSPVSPEALTQQVISPTADGSLQLSLVTAARRNGLVAYELVPEMLALFEEVSAGRPPIVLLNQSLAWWPMYHYAVVVGYDLDRSDMLLHSGLQIPEHMSMTPFEHSWSRAGQWAFVLLKPGELPSNPDRLRYLKAVNGVEAAGRLDSAEQAYRTALARWPNDPSSSIGLANVLSKHKKNSAAIKILESSLKMHPQHAALLNNLAEELAAVGRVDEAEQIATEASMIVGPFQASSKATLRKIQQQRTAEFSI